jgi:sugar/nucleoside kinase (ribokinase family)
MKDALWSHDKFVRASAGSASSVATVLANLGGKVAFMGKFADDEYGQAMLYHKKAYNVRSVSIDCIRATGMSLMKIGKRI